MQHRLPAAAEWALPCAVRTPRECRARLIRGCGFGVMSCWTVKRRDARLTKRSAQYMYSRFWAFLLTVKRDTQKERTTKSRNSWGARFWEKVRWIDTREPLQYHTITHETTDSEYQKSAAPPAPSMHHGWWVCRLQTVVRSCRYMSTVRTPCVRAGAVLRKGQLKNGCCATLSSHILVCLLAPFRNP